MQRRAFLQLPAGLAALAVGSASEDRDSNTKIATAVDVHTMTDDHLLLLKQIGLRWVHAEFSDDGSYDAIKTAVERFSRYGLQIHSGLVNTYRSERIQLGRPGRDEDIEKFQQFLRDLGKFGVYSAKIDFHPGNTYTTAMVESSRGYRVREFSLDDFRNKVEKQRFDRVYTADDMWANYRYFIKAVLPVAEQADVRLALHPDDPPISMMNGVAKLFIHYDAIKRAEEEIAGGSKYWGLTLCVGTWSEGGDKMGKDVFGMIDDFGRRGKIFAVHFRNVSSPLPRFHETFQDDGYLDMYEVMKAFRRARCTASLIPDHYPGLAGDQDHRMADVYSLSMMRTLLRRANLEVG
jgi:mannonate dehydratase